MPIIFKICKKSGCGTHANLSGYCPNHKKQMDMKRDGSYEAGEERRKASDKIKRGGIKY